MDINVVMRDRWVGHVLLSDRPSAVGLLCDGVSRKGLGAHFTPWGQLGGGLAAALWTEGTWLLAEVPGTDRL